MLVTALALVGLAIGGGVWLVRQRAELQSEVATTVAQAVSLRRRFHFQEARQLLEQVQQRVARAGPENLRRQVDRARADVILTQGLDNARTQAANFADGTFTHSAAEPLYVSAFADAGLGRDGDEIEVVAAAVRERAVREEIVAALDDWASITSELRRREWLLAVARGADPDGVRDRLRQPDLWLDGTRLTRIAKELRVAELSPQLVTALSRVSRMSGGETVALLTAAQQRFPQDFWVTFELAWALNQEHRRDEGLGYFRAALALRPDSTAVYTGLGEILFFRGRVDEAIDSLEQALRLDPRNTHAHNNLALALSSKGRLDAAIDHYQQALSITPNSAVLHHSLRLALRGCGRLDEAIEHFQRSVGIDPNYATGHLGPRAYLVARTCTLAPDAVADASLPGRFAEKELNDSAREFWSLTEQGALTYRAGRFQQAVPFFEQSLQADPRPGSAVLNWLWLALTNQRIGKTEEATHWLGKAQAWLDQYRDGMPARAEQELGLHLHNWLEAHVLRREAEARILFEASRIGTENREWRAPQ
jgi:eukaryotic-like serine/threonine-protein kinase